MTYVVIHSVSSYNNGRNGSANAEDFSDTGQRIGTAIGTWYAPDYGTLVNGVLTRAATAFSNYSEIRLDPGFYVQNKSEVDTWLMANPNYARRVTGVDVPYVPTNMEPNNIALAEAQTVQDLANAAQQLVLKSGMLQSDKAVFASPEVYRAALDSTNDQIRTWNQTIAGMNAPDNPALTSGGRIVDAGAARGDGGIESQVIDDADEPKEGNSAWMLVLIPFVLLGVVLLYLTGRK